MQGENAPSWRNDNARKCRYCDRKFTKEEHLRRHERTRESGPALARLGHRLER